MVTTPDSSLLTLEQFNDAVQAELKSSGKMHYHNNPATKRAFTAFNNLGEGEALMLPASEVKSYTRKLVNGLDRATAGKTDSAKIFTEDLVSYKNLLKGTDGKPYQFSTAQETGLKKSVITDYNKLLKTPLAAEEKSFIGAYKDLKALGITKPEIQQELAGLKGSVPSLKNKPLVISLSNPIRPEVASKVETVVEKGGRKWFQFFTHTAEGSFSGKRAGISAAVAAVGGIALMSRRHSQEPEQTTAVER